MRSEPCGLRGGFRALLFLGILLSTPGRPLFALEPAEVFAVITPNSYPPYITNNDSEGPVGFSVDVLEAVAARANLKVSFKTAPSWPAALEMLRIGEADIIPSMGISDARRDIANFSVPVKTSNVVLIARRDGSDMGGVSSLAGRTVGVVERNIGHTLMKGRNEIELNVYSAFSVALFALLSGQVDAVVYPQEVAWRLAAAAEVDDRIRVVGPPIREIRRGIAVRKDATEIYQLIDSATRSFVESDEYREIYARWFGTPRPILTVDRLIWTSCILLVLVVLAMAIWRYRSVLKLNRELRNAVEQRQRAIDGLRDAKEQAQLANRAKDTFLAHMSHELRTPLNSILGFSECISNEIFGNVNKTEYLEYAGYIHEAGGHLLNLINDLLDISKIEAGQQSVSDEQVDMRDIVARCCVMLRDRALQQKVEIVNLLPENLPLLIADERHCKQIVLNLLSNAVKFTPADGRVTVSGWVLDNAISLQISDTGRGIPPDQIKDVVKPFRQIEDVLTREHEGSGLGLCLVDKLMRLHDGVLSITSKVGEGTAATIQFPENRTGPAVTELSGKSTGQRVTRYGSALVH